MILRIMPDSGNIFYPGNRKAGHRAGVYEFEKGKQQVTLKPFEDIAAVVEEKFENILNDADYEVTRAKFYERVYLDEKQKYKADPIWYFEVVENNISKSVTLINAETGKEIFLQ